MYPHSLSVKWGNYSPGQEPTELTRYKNDCPHGQMQGPHTYKWIGRKGQSQSSKCHYGEQWSLFSQGPFIVIISERTVVMHFLAVCPTLQSLEHHCQNFCPICNSCFLLNKYVQNVLYINISNKVPILLVIKSRKT